MKFLLALLCAIAVNAAVIPESVELVARDPAKNNNAKKNEQNKKNNNQNNKKNNKNSNGKAANASNGQKLPQCGTLNGSLCTSSGSFAVTSADALIAKCNACGAAAGAAGAGKLADCLAKVKGGDRNPAMPANTFGHTATFYKIEIVTKGQCTQQQYFTLERNTKAVGQPSSVCKQTPKNKELQLFAQHQDAAGPDAAANNKNVKVQVAKQAVALGFSAEEAVNLSAQTATFPPGDTNDKSGKGSTCDGLEVKGGPNVFANKDGKVLGLEIKKGDQIDCVTLALLNKDKKHAPAPAISKDDLLSELSSALEKRDAAKNSGRKNVQNKGRAKRKRVTLPRKTVTPGTKQLKQTRTTAERKAKRINKLFVY
ncbi:hypothetical protein HDV06_004397 [Boothiomyces sp. JEL0866]|nr:hypothetical protein HDV06_004397 [Boothiomyces sp. JEL0866]